MSALDEVLALVNDPDPYRNAPANLAELQLEAARERFAQHQPSIKVLARRSQDAGISEIRSFDDLVPLLFVVYLSVKSISGILATPLSLPDRVHTENYSQAWSGGDLGRYLVNTVLVAGVTVLAVLVLSSLAAFVIARYTFRGNQLLYLFFVSGLALQGAALAWIAIIAGPQVSYAAMVAPLFISGAGLGLAIPAVTKAVVGSVPLGDIGKASGAFSTMRQLGGAFGVAEVPGAYVTPGMALSARLTVLVSCSLRSTACSVLA